MQNKYLDFDVSIISQELTNLDSEKQFEFAFEKEQPLEKRNSILFRLANRWIWRSQMETDIKWAKSKKEANGLAIFHSHRDGNADFKIGTIRHSRPFKKHYQKEGKKWKGPLQRVKNEIEQNSKIAILKMQ